MRFALLIKSASIFILSSAVLLLTFQNCAKVKFSSVETVALSASLQNSWCANNPESQECVTVPAPTCTFNGQSYEEGAQITAFADSTVGFGKICNVEERLCTKGSFSGSFAYADCAVGLPASCLFEGRTIPSGQSVSAFQNSSVVFGSNCQPENRKCENGVLSGSYTFGACAVGVPNDCQFNGQTVSHGTSVNAFTNSTLPFGQACAPVVRSCFNGILIGSGNFASCTVEAPASCLFDGKTIAHSGSVTAFLNSSVAYGLSCLPQSRRCTNGVLDGTHAFGSCTVGAAAACQFNGQTIANGQSVSAFQNSSAAFGKSCAPENRKCDNGNLSGSFNFATCAVDAPASCLFDNKTVAHGEVVKAFQNSTVAYGALCAVEDRVCNNGSLGGTYGYPSCAVNQPASCQFNGQALSSGQSVTAFLNPSPAYGEACVSQIRLCTDGSLSGMNTAPSCTIGLPKSCSFNGQTYSHGQQVTAYRTGSVLFGQSCEQETRTCNNGVLTGLNEFGSCSVGSPASCLIKGRTIAHNETVLMYNSDMVTYGNLCSNLNRTCNNGTLSGAAAYSYLACAAAPASPCDFNGQSIADGAAVTAFASNSVPYGQQCQSEQRSCSNGRLSGTNTQNSCIIQSAPVASCTVSVDKTNFSTTEYMTFTTTSKEASNVQKNCWNSWHEMPLNGTKTYDPYTWSGKYTCRFRAINKHTFQPVDCNPTAVYLDVW